MSGTIETIGDLASQIAVAGGEPDCIQVNPMHVTASPRLLAERQSRLDAIGQRPPWWRLLARRRWRKARARIMAMDVSQCAEWLREWYAPSSVVEAARARVNRKWFKSVTGGVK